MPKPTDSLTSRRHPEEVLADCLRGLADELTNAGYGEHGLIVRLAAWDYQRLAALQRENGIGLTAEQARESL